jgi:lambda family phage portal protein
MGGGYEGASTIRRALSEWDVAVGSADNVTLFDLPTLRERSRDLVRNNPLAAGAINTNVTSTVGRGLRVQPRIDRDLLGLSEEQADDWERRARHLFLAVSDQLDITRTQPFWGLQDLACRSPLEAGDLFVVRRYRKNSGDVLGLKLQLVEADRVCNPHHLQDAERLRAGVEFDEWGAPVAYHAADRHPGDLFALGISRWTRLPAFGSSGERLVLHLFKRKRVGQSRGVPYLAPAIEAFKQLGRYSEAEIMAAVINAFLTVFITSKTDDEGVPLLAGINEEEDGTAGAALESNEYKLGSGTILGLGENESVQTVATNRPNSNYDPFVMAVLRQAGVALELPFEVLVKHFTASYSASRAALLEAWRYFLVSRHWVATSFCQPTYEWVIAEAVSRGLLEAPGFFDDPLIRRAWSRAAWIGDAMGQLDPKKEADAAVVRINNGLSDLELETAQMVGMDWEDVHAQRAKEARRRRQDGLDIEPIAERVRTEPVDSQPPPAEPEYPSDRDTDEEEES